MSFRTGDILVRRSSLKNDPVLFKILDKVLIPNRPRTPRAYRVKCLHSSANKDTVSTLSCFSAHKFFRKATEAERVLYG